MSLSAGARLGPYEILSPLGAGGMGEVYRARDTKLGRDVAIKFLPAQFTTDPDRLARFEREARMLASLNHPHIGAIYGFEESDGVRALVLELVEGLTLADRIGAGVRSRSPKRCEIAKQIAEALDAAHERGIVHRDLKPANIKITPDGAVKVLDFGLAKAPVRRRCNADLTQSPTMTVGGTREGVILGTAAYMSPEQARGQAVDKRTDIWAFGCVLYEMLTGRAAFARRRPSRTRLPRSSSASPTGRCCRRRRRRACGLLRAMSRERSEATARDIGDVRAELEHAPPAAIKEDQAPPRIRARRVGSLVFAGMLLVAAAAIAAYFLRTISQVHLRPALRRQIHHDARCARLGQSGPSSRRVVSRWFAARVRRP